ncbi:MAG: glycosyltransferase, partial [Myxococcota bacterium]|nr:glycosyltransferase [Myxococcota bacterium]
MNAVEIVVLTKDPIPGRVKTRLIPALGPEGAARFHVAMALETLLRARATGMTVRVALHGDPTGAFAA